MDYYSTLAPGYNELHKAEQLAKLNIISRHLKVQKQERLLDVGCGTGFSKEIFECRIVGVEPSREMLISGRDEKGLRMDLLQGEGESLPFSDKSFDSVICVTSLHNFRNPEKGLKEMKRVGKEKGAVTVLKKAKKARDLVGLVRKIFAIELILEEDKDVILFFGLLKS